MRYTYVASDTTAATAPTLGAVGQDVYVKKVIFGTLADGKILILYDKSVVIGQASGIGSADTTNVALKFTQSTAAAGKQWDRVVDFTSDDCPGLQLDGGAVHTDASSVTVIWEPVDEAI